MSRRQISPTWLVLIGIASVQFGAAIAKHLFDRIEPTAMVWLRLVTSALVLVAIARPRLRGRSRADWLTVLAFGVTLGSMNWAIYQSFARIPLGLAVTIEFAGPLILSVVMSRRARDLLWVALAALGVGLLGFEKTELDLVGVGFALLAGAAWAAYILLSVQTGRRWPGLDGLAMASVVASVMLAPLAIPVGGSDLLDPTILALGAAVGPAELGDPVRRGPDGAAPDAPGRVQHPDEPGAGGRRPGRHAPARRVPEPAAVAGRRGRDGRERRGDPQPRHDQRADAQLGRGAPMRRVPWDDHVRMTAPTPESARTRRSAGSRRPAESVVEFHHILSDDGTRLRAWTNDPLGRIDGPTVLLCNGLGVSPWTWPALLHADCGVRVVSWNHRGTGGSARPKDPDRVGIEEFVEDALSVMDHFGVDRARGDGVVDGRQHGLRARAAPPRAGHRRSSRWPGVPGDTFATMLGPLRLPHAVARRLTVTLSRALRTSGRVISPLTTRLPFGARGVAALTHSGFMLPTPDNELTARAVREFLAIPVEWYFHLALRTSEHARVSLRRVKVPVMLVAATYDVLAGARDMRTAADRLEDATYVELRASHFVQMEQPEVVHDLLLGFLEELEG